MPHLQQGLGLRSAASLAAQIDYIPLPLAFNGILFLLTNRCNLTCRHCYVASSPRGEFGLSLDRSLLFLDEAYRLLGEVDFFLSGGEALVRRSDSFAIMEKASRRFRVWLLTNGTLLDPSTSARLKELDVNVRLSLDGGSSAAHDFMRGPGAYERLLRGVRNLQSVNYPPHLVSVFCALSPENIDEIDDILNLAADFGLAKVKFEPVCKTGRASENWFGRATAGATDPDTQRFRDFFLHDFARRHGRQWRLIDLEPIELSWRTLNVYADGAVFPYTFTNDVDRELGELGNLNSQSLAEILDPRRVSQALVSKFIMFARHERRSLHAYLACSVETGA